MKTKEPIMPIKVECYAGYRGEETPRAVWFKSRKIEIKQVLDRWLDPNHRYFKLLGDDAGIYIMRLSAKHQLIDNVTVFVTTSIGKKFMRIIQQAVI